MAQSIEQWLASTARFIIFALHTGSEVIADN